MKKILAILILILSFSACTHKAQEIKKSTKYQDSGFIHPDGSPALKFEK